MGASHSGAQWRTIVRGRDRGKRKEGGALRPGPKLPVTRLIRFRHECKCCAQNAVMEIKDRAGKLIHKSDNSRDFCELDLRTAVFTGMLLQGAVFDDSNLSGASFRRADLYWSNFFRADLTGAFSLTESVGRLMIPAVTIDSRHESTLVRYHQRDGRFPGQRIM